MHAGLDYERYLAEKDSTQADLDAWRESKWGKRAADMHLMPTSEDRSTDDLEEDMRQRIHMSKVDIEVAQAANPEANFSLSTPFSILTKDEFATRINNSFAQGNGTLNRIRARSLRAQYDLTTAAKMNRIVMSSADETEGSTLGGSQVAAKPVATAMSFISETRRPKHSTQQKSTTTTAPVATEEATATESGTVDWSTSACMSPIQNQGQCGDCWAFATISAVESAQCIAGGQKSISKYSEQRLVSCNTQNNGCNGGAPQYALDYILENGLCSETGFPYVSDEGSVPSCTACSKLDAGIAGYDVLEVGDEAGLIESINARPTIVTVAAGNEAWKQYTGGVLSSCDTSALDHLVVAVGYDSSSLKIRNSWGDSWGEDGYIRLKRASSGSGTCSVMEQMVPIKM